MIAAMAAGALLLLGPAVLKTRFGVDEVVTTLLLNFIVLLFVSMLLEGAAEGPDGRSAGRNRPRSSPRRSCRASSRASACTTASSSRIVAADRRSGSIMKKTVLGYEMRAVGHNARGRRASPAFRSTAC